MIIGIHQDWGYLFILNFANPNIVDQLHTIDYINNYWYLHEKTPADS